ncbi:natural resistance-associated macrophage protein-domain-containing protein [Fomitopsis serialis]|uniref:natural resistance-associated macrophage protein-domain-containing protein n=1 Tax=Fomitopsis serialis TaxID=139415 RepID=UPI002008510A|nr:natural resistance-associated macrophage protein-domain-containing protein [Neoantrodia serialis]KAH9929792.1 natural resistance-associated macrophage protein-domain-containing protein [Neoantrodia serialis]
MAGASSITASSGSSPAAAQPSGTSFSQRLGSTAAKVGKNVVRHSGAGIVCAVAYFDPGNWSVDLHAGSRFGFALLFSVMQASFIAIQMQGLATRLGCYTLFWRWGVLYPLYALSEIAIVATDLADLLGSAIALTLLFPGLPMYAGVVLTALDVLLLLGVKNPVSGAPAKSFEFFIVALIFAMLLFIGIAVSKASVQWAAVLGNLLPSAAAFSLPGSFYLSIGIIGSTVKPHTLFLGSALATQERETEEEALGEKEEAWASTPTLGEKTRSFMTNVKAGFSRDSFVGGAKRAFENRSLGFVRRHLMPGAMGLNIGLFGMALIINALILILASAVFFYGPNGGPGHGVATFFDAYDMFVGRLGQAAATVFALALLAAGLGSSIVATLAGQVVCEGFIRWKLSPVVRRLLTRSLGLIPAVIITAALGRAGVSALLVVSQVVLAIVLPFIMVPLILLTSSKKIMTAKAAVGGGNTLHQDLASQSTSSLATAGMMESRSELNLSNPQRWQSQTTLQGVPERASGTGDVEKAEETEDFSMAKGSIVFAWVTWAMITGANSYTIILLAMGKMNGPSVVARTFTIICRP